MKARAGVVNESGRVPADGPALAVVLRDEAPGQSWTIRISARTPLGSFVVGSVVSIPYAAHGSASRRVATAHVPGVTSWDVLVTGSSLAAAPYAAAALELVVGDDGGGCALEATPGASYIADGADVDGSHLGVAENGVILARPGRVLEIAALNTGSDPLWLYLWSSTALASDGSPPERQPIPLPAGELTVRRWSRPLAVSPRLAWGSSATALTFTPSAPVLLVSAQVE